MSDVQRYYLGKYGLVEGEALGRLSVVLAADFDRVTAECKALQERLNVADQKDDDLEFQLNDREGSRRDWFDEAKRLEKEVEGLRSDVEKQRRLKMLVAEKLQNALNNCSVYRVHLADRDALLRDVVDGKHTTPGWNQRMKAALSASAEPNVPAESAGLVGVEDVAELIGARIKARAALDKSTEGASHEL